MVQLLLNFLSFFLDIFFFKADSFDIIVEIICVES